MSRPAILTREEPAVVVPLRVLAIDASTHTGWAHNGQGFTESGVQDFSLRRGESPGMRWIHFTHWAEWVMSQLKPDVVVYEQAHHRGGAATEIGVGMVTRIVEIATRNGAEYRSCHSATLKKHATGKGNATKEEMVLAACGTIDGMDDNEADARHLLAWALAGFPEAAAKPKRARKKAAEGANGG